MSSRLVECDVHGRDAHQLQPGQPKSPQRRTRQPLRSMNVRDGSHHAVYGSHMFRIKPPKPLAILSAIIAAGMVALALTEFRDAPPLFLIMFIGIAVSVAVINLWAAFHPRGSVQTVERDPSQ